MGVVATLLTYTHTPLPLLPDLLNYLLTYLSAYITCYQSDPYSQMVPASVGGRRQKTMQGWAQDRGNNPLQKKGPQFSSHLRSSHT